MSTIENLYDIFLKHRKITTDSRNVPAGALFFALKGETFDGNTYAPQAIKNGASQAVVDDPGYRGREGFIVVEDVLTALQDLARRHRKQMKSVVLAITGSNGKTTTKELTREILSRKYACKATLGNLNNHIGVPLTILSMEETLDYAIIEMGANHIGEIADLSAIADPGFGLITNVGKAHLEGFGNFEGVVKAKTELYRYLKSHGGKVFINSANPILTRTASGIETIEYGKSGNEVTGKVTRSNPAMSLDCTIGSRKLSISTNLVGAYNLENVLAAISIGNYFGVSDGDIKEAIESYFPENNRSQVLQTPKNTLIMDAYNANPSSMEASILNFAEGEYDNKILILGEMLELGADADAEHHKITDFVRGLGFTKAFLVGKGFKMDNDEVFRYFDTTDDLVDHLLKYQLAGYTILIKGSRGNKLEKVINYL